MPNVMQLLQRLQFQSTPIKGQPIMYDPSSKIETGLFFVDILVVQMGQFHDRRLLYLGPHRPNLI